MGRELRRVPANWQHPRKDDGTYQPMFNRFYGDELKEWMVGHELWEEGTHPDLVKDPTLKQKYPFYAMYHGNPPDVKYYQTRKYKEEELTHIQLYQTTSEGTPLSPVFKADELDALCEWAEKNATTFAIYKTTKEEWKRMLLNDFVYHQSGNAIFI